MDLHALFLPNFFVDLVQELTQIIYRTWERPARNRKREKLNVGSATAFCFVRQTQFFNLLICKGRDNYLHPARGAAAISSASQSLPLGHGKIARRMQPASIQSGFM